MIVFLIGFMGCGKSYHGKRIAEKFQMDFVDLDDFIVEKEKQSIQEIFSTKKENGFRKMEKKYLQSFKNKKNIVIACGGGTPCFHNNIKWMNQHGLTIYLRTSNTLLFEQLNRKKYKRPLLNGLTSNQMKTFIKNKVAERNVFYEQAEKVIYHRKGDEGFAERLQLIVEKCL